MDREEFYRLKKVKNNKQRDAAEAEKGAKERAIDEDTNGAEPADILGEQEDADVIF